MMRLKVLAAPDEKKTNLTTEWGCNALPTPPGSFRFTTHAFRFRAPLTGEGVELELTMV